jgi:hypothetical protein
MSLFITAIPLFLSISMAKHHSDMPDHISILFLPVSFLIYQASNSKPTKQLIKKVSAQLFSNKSGINNIRVVDPDPIRMQ